MFNYICTECGQGTVKVKVFKNYKTKIKGYPFVVNEAIVGVCDRCGAKHFNAQETKRWEELYLSDLESRHIFLTPEEIDGLRKALGLSMEDFAYLIGCTRQSIYNWEKKDRERPQSRMADLIMKLVKKSFEEGAFNVMDFLEEEAKKLDIFIEVKRKDVFKAPTVLTFIPKRVKREEFKTSADDSLRLAAEATGEEEVLVVETSDQKFTGILDYDYSTAMLFIKIRKNDLGLNRFDVALQMDNGDQLIKEDAVVQNNQLILKEEIEDIKERIVQIILKAKN